MKLKIEIELDNDAFEHGNYSKEIARILCKAIHKMEGLPDLTDQVLRDLNSNTVGKLEFID